MLLRRSGVSDRVSTGTSASSVPTVTPVISTPVTCNPDSQGWLHDVVIFVISWILMTISKFVLFMRYQLWGYKLPPMAPILSVIWWQQAKGSFALHRMPISEWASSSSKDDASRGDEAVAGLAVPFKGLHVSISDSALIESVMADKATYASRGDVGFQSWIPQGLLALPTGPQWRLHRRLVTRFLATDYLRKYMLVMQKFTMDMIEEWKIAADSQEPQDVQRQVSHWALLVISQVAFGIDSVFQSKEDYTAHQEKAEIILGETTRRYVDVVPFMEYITPARQRRFREAVQWCREKLAAGGTFDGQEEGDLNMISMLRKVQRDGTEKLTDEEIIQEVMTLNGAGHETTANTLSWAFLMLAHHPHEQAKLQREADEIVKGPCASLEETQKLTDTLCALYESIRMYPTVPVFQREVAADTTLGGYDIPKGSFILINNMKKNRDPNVFPDPDTYRPSRFRGVSPPKPGQPVDIPGTRSYSFLPFGAGGRSCVGQRLAIAEALQIISAVMKTFTIRVPDGHPPVTEYSSISLRPKGMRLIFEKRTNV
eukprot:m.138086 g.138086  ORF g.138086 m.138086 type:complete len:542 (+) comp11478_c0_seq1:1842-3467(+)